MIDKSCTTLLKDGVIKQLTHCVRGFIHISVINDTMYIDITPNSSIAFRYTEENLFDKILQGTTSEMIVNNCLTSYSRYINCQFFKNKSVDNRK